MTKKELEKEGIIEALSNEIKRKGVVDVPKKYKRALKEMEKNGNIKLTEKTVNMLFEFPSGKRIRKVTVLHAVWQHEGVIDSKKVLDKAWSYVRTEKMTVKAAFKRAWDEARA